jgi:hypothetical protein
MEFYLLRAWGVSDILAGLAYERLVNRGRQSVGGKMHEFRFEPVLLPTAAKALRSEVRAFIAEEVARGAFTPSRNSWSSFDPDFSRKCGEHGYIGMRWPKEYGGHERSALERYVVTEEMLAGGAPVGVCFFSIGMSEPDSGSDLAAVRTRAARVEGGWKINGTKVWTSGAHRTNYLIALARTAPKAEDRHAGMTQFIVDLSHPGVSVRPIYNLYGGHDFNEVVFDEFFVADDMVMGEVGMGWKLVTGELAFERSGPDRFLSTYQLLVESIRAIGPDPDERAANEIGRIVAHLATLRRMSTSVAGMLERGAQPVVEAALVKDIGTAFEREIPETFRHLIPTEPTLGEGASYAELLGMTILRAPGFTIRGGTREILRGMIARGLGLR